MKHNRTSEAEIGRAVLVILAQSPGGEASLAELRDQVPNHVHLTAEDRAPSLTRKGEELWEQIVRNITSHKESPGNLIAEGLVENHKKGKLRITSAGHLYLK